MYADRPKHWAHLITNENIINCRVDLIIVSKSWDIAIVSTMYYIIKGSF